MMLVVCQSDEHEAKILKVFIPFDPETLFIRPFAPLMGHRFDKIVVFDRVENRNSRFVDWMEDYLKLKLTADGELIIL